MRSLYSCILLKFESSKFTLYFTLTTHNICGLAEFQVLNSHMWLELLTWLLEASVLDSTAPSSTLLLDFFLTTSYSPTGERVILAWGLWRVIKHTTLHTGQMRSTTIYLLHILTAWGGGHFVPCQTTQGLHLGRSEQPWAVRNRLCSTKRVSWPLVPIGTCDWLVWKKLCRLASNSNPPFRGKQKLLGLLDKDSFG